MRLIKIVTRKLISDSDHFYICSYLDDDEYIFGAAPTNQVEVGAATCPEEDSGKGSGECGEARQEAQAACLPQHHPTAGSVC